MAMLASQRWAFAQITQAVPDGVPVLDQYSEPQDDSEEAWVRVSYGDYATQQLRGGKAILTGSIIADCYSRQDNQDRADFVANACAKAVARRVNNASDAQFMSETRANAPRLQGWWGLRVIVPFRTLS